MAVENRKKKKNKMSVPLMIVLVICVVVLGVSIWQLSGIFIEYKKSFSLKEEAFYLLFCCFLICPKAFFVLK